MGILSSVAPIGGLIKLAAGLVLPRIPGGRAAPKSDFSEVLRNRRDCPHTKNVDGPQGILDRAGLAADRMLRLLDSNGDGVLNRSELGMNGASMGRLDLDGDGVLNKAELVRAYVERDGAPRVPKPFGES